jgi:hypothetical protein
VTIIPLDSPVVYGVKKTSGRKRNISDGIDAGESPPDVRVITPLPVITAPFTVRLFLHDAVFATVGVTGKPVSEHVWNLVFATYRPSRRCTDPATSIVSAIIINDGARENDA